MGMTKVGEGIRFDPDAPAEPLRHLIAQRYPGELRRDGIEQAVELQGTRRDRALLPTVSGMVNQAMAVNKILAACPPGKADAVQHILNGVALPRSPGQLEVGGLLYHRWRVVTPSE
ncbi:hypothetical protein Q668_07370 [Alcanivorax sp. PN-3]|nr:hypothetical protein Q668_07370 [Alcanivorax sp. PN-3]